MAGTIMPFPKHQFFDANGDPAAAALLFWYAAGTSTKVTVHSDAALTVPLANPTTLDAAGRVAAGGIFLTPGISYKVVLAPPNDTDPPASPYWTIDGVQSVPPSGSATDLDISGTAGENLAAVNVVYLSDGSGGATAGRFYKADSDNTYSSTAAYQMGMAPSAISSGGSGTVRLSGRVTGLAGLTAGALYYVSATAGGLTSTPPTNARPVGVADSTTSIIISPWVFGQEASATTGGRLTIGAQSIAGVKSFLSTPLFAPGSVATADAIPSGVISSNVVPVGNVGAGTDDLMTFTVKANTLSVNGKMLRVTAWGDYAANANNKTLTFALGSDTIVGHTAQPYNAIVWNVVIMLVRVTSATERCGLIYQSSSSGGTLLYNDASFTRDLTAANILKFTGVGTSNNDVRQLGMIVEVVG